MYGNYVNVEIQSRLNVKWGVLKNFMTETHTHNISIENAVFQKSKKVDIIEIYNLEKSFLSYLLITFVFIKDLNKLVI